MPIILASLVFAFALAALPSTEPLSPDEKEQAEYVAYLKEQREKRRRKVRHAHDEEERKSSEKIVRDHKTIEGWNLIQSEEDEGDDGRRRRKCTNRSRRGIDGLGLDLPYEMDTNAASSRERTFHRLVSDSHRTIAPSPSYHKTHLRRSSSVPSLSSSSAGSSRASSPGTSPKRFSATLI
ncbi:hypothetical protein I302_109101 [Kwoniella bestiolae CBS 10118]|uniref:Uncharacterized protein n=1 Tax=Kwoniella bestiolae CBS 10118 TaxID=1296100 RepID=A0A1B9FUZ5_9TREE|nr:hypothetical protein I302_08246 [Kwoniella bestiolae CBS 10118]OCF22596.1 hypothetical protein I302_08246 [Kwoniella bestiolae CBS 10118]